jgi:gamma-glutamyl:cysteine ligase YbdK (ATP-grasp superfamily)
VSPAPLHLFDALGIEMEYMLVDLDSLDIRSDVDLIFKAASGSFVSDFEDGAIAWSNELVRHVMEVKVNAPVSSMSGLTAAFQRSLDRINQLAAEIPARLLPTAMHPWMDPAKETQLWPHEYAEVYRTFDRVFDCRRHGWANLQSVHVNLPFCGDDEFARLHAAVRLVLPLIPALAASSPVMEGRRNGVMDNRLDVYTKNSRIIPHITGDVIPEPVYSHAAYDELIFQPMYRAIAPFDPEEILQDEFLNARGAIARFDRNAIEIRLIDVQETPAADLAIVQAVVHAVRWMVEEKTCPWAAQSVWQTGPLRAMLHDTIREADQTVITDLAYLKLWGVDAPCTANVLWQTITNDLVADDRAIDDALKQILERGPLARRMVKRLPNNPTRDDLMVLYRELADCLADGRML